MKTHSTRPDFTTGLTWPIFTSACLIALLSGCSRDPVRSGASYPITQQLAQPAPATSPTLNRPTTQVNWQPSNTAPSVTAAGSELPKPRLYDFVMSSLSNRLAGKSRSDLFPLTPQSFAPSGDGYAIGFTNWKFAPKSAWRGMAGLQSIEVWRPRFHDSPTTNSGTGTLISPRHILHANHAGVNGYYVGSKVFFVGSNNVIEMAREIGFYNLATNIYLNDCQIGILDRDLTNVQFARVLPTNAAAYMTNGMPLLLRQGSNYLWVGQNVTGFGRAVGFRPSQVWTNLTNPGAIGGDSGGSIFLPIGDELVAVANITTSVSANWTIPHYYHEINAAMSNLSVTHQAPVYQLTPIDLSPFVP